MDEDYQAVMTARKGQDESDFPFLSLPPEIRNIIYRQALVQYPFVSSTRQPALLPTNRQIRDEAFAMYYAQNDFYVIIMVPGSHVLQRIQRLVQNLPMIIETHIRNITFSVHYRIDDVSPSNDALRYFLNHLPYGFILRDRKVKGLGAKGANYSTTRRNFVAGLLTDEAALTPGVLSEITEGFYDRELLPRALEQFDAAWLLAHIFPEAEKKITTTAHLPNGRRSHTLW